jgi:dienelactone hydrolase
MRHSIAALLIAIVCMLPSQTKAQDEAAAIDSPAMLWRGVDVAEPLDIEIEEAWQEPSGIALEALRFTGERAGDTRVRVFAYRGYPKEPAQAPGILHIHGGGQTASIDWVRYWTTRGYACVSLDFCGPWQDRKRVTDWGPIAHANMAQAAGGLQLMPTPRESSWFHWALVCRRALTVLASDQRVDPQRLGIFGISVGGTLTWLVAGSDQRVKAAVPIYGCGYNYDRRNARWDMLAPSDTFNTWQRVISPEAHAPYIACPILFLSATNDFHGVMDWADPALAATNGPHFQAFSARTDHHVEPREGKNLALWMDWHLRGGAPFPKPPELSITLDSAGAPQAMLKIIDGDVESIEVFYALGDRRPQVRFWRGVAGQREQGTNTWRAPLPILDAWAELHAFANVQFKAGPCLSTPLVHVIPAQLGKAAASLRWSAEIGGGSSDLSHWKFLGGYTDPNLDWEHLEVRTDGGRKYVAFQDRLGDPAPVQLYTHAIGDDQYRGRDSDALALTVRGDFGDAGLKVSLVEHDRGRQARAYSTVVPNADLGPDWRTVVISRAQFHDDQGQAPASWRGVDKLELRGRASAPGVADLRWVAPGR